MKLLRPLCWKQSLSPNHLNRGKIGCQRWLLGNQSAKHHILSFTKGHFTTATAKVHWLQRKDPKTVLTGFSREFFVVTDSEAAWLAGLARLMPCFLLKLLLCLYEIVEACVAECLTPQTADLEVRDSSPAHRVVSLDKQLYSTLSQVYKWVPATHCWGLTLRWASIASTGE